ncbi:hypothetical protein DL764_002750 [Monosporascus ibericus]|uniref:Uncharacterized protein n=1 Tax=Monosporascus ibericus TaxID=155417 RepID=A0A4V1XBQ4_9PEZI|nr:hypothetical protein DL764_002750 [Monosporascus ibericus]
MHWNGQFDVGGVPPGRAGWQKLPYRFLAKGMNQIWFKAQALPARGQLRTVNKTAPNAATEPNERLPLSADASSGLL